VSTAGTVPEGTRPPEDAEPKGIKTGRNLPAAIGVGVILGGLALLTLLTVKATFLIYMGAALAVALYELDAALKTRDIKIPLIPVALGGAAMLTAAYWAAGGAVAAAFALTVIAILGWRMIGRHDGQLRANLGPVSFLQAAAFQFLNPKAWIMTVTAATLFLPRELGPLLSGLYMAGIMEGIGLPCMAVWALFGSSLRQLIGAPRGRMVFNVAMAVALAMTAVMMVR